MFGVALTADDLAHAVVDGMLACEPMPDGSRLAVAYVAWDEYPPPALHDGGDGRGRVLRVEAGEAGARVAREFAFASEASGLSVHEAPLASPRDARPATGRTWDGPRLMHAGAGADVAAAAREMVAHAAWRSGELCGVVVEVFARDGEGGLVSVDQVAEWPRVGREDALGLLPEALAPRVAPAGPSFR